MTIDLKHRIAGKTCTLIRLENDEVCGQDAYAEFRTPDSDHATPSAYLCEEHARKWLIEMAMTNNATFASKIERRT